MPAECKRSVYESGAWEVDLARRELRADGVSVPIGSRAFDIIAVLVEKAGELVTKDDLMRRVWSGAIVEDNTLQVHISAVRKALGSDRGMLKTTAGRGYRLVGSWTTRQGHSAVARTDVEAQKSNEPFRTNLSVAAPALIGRALAAQHVRDLLSANRAVTLTGPGGIGKTVLAVDCARSLLPTFGGDIFLVELASLSDPGLTPSAVAAALRLRLGGDEISAESVARTVGGRKLLLVLDNCEHLIDAAARLVDTFLRMCSQTTILATSREVLRIEGEFVFRVPPLDVPAPLQQHSEELLEHSAVQLFIARTKASESGFSVHEKDLSKVSVICRHLDGIPLAIEFAAARTAALGLTQVAAHLGDRFGLLTVGRRTALPRHQTLQATLDWSYDLLPVSERLLLRHLGVFAAGFTLEAAAAVMRESTSATVAEGIANLVAKSLVTVDGSVPSGRWRILETIRVYALKKLEEGDEGDKAAHRHASFFRDIFAKIPSNFTSRSTEDDPRDVREIDNIRAALNWSFTGGEPKLGFELTVFSAPHWFQWSLMAEYRERSERALHYLQSSPEPNAAMEMRLLISLGHALWYSANDPDAMERVFSRALTIAEAIGDAASESQALWGLWAVQRGCGDYPAALAIALKYATVSKRADDQRIVVLGDRILGLTYHYLGQQPLARQYVERVVSLTRHTDERPNNDFQVDVQVAMAALLARIQWLQGFPDQAITTAREAIDAALQMNHWFSICYVLYIAGCPLSLWTGNLEEAQLRIRMLWDRAAGNSFADRWARCFSRVLQLRQGSEHEVLIASFIELRMDVPTIASLATRASAVSIPVPVPDADPNLGGDSWNTPELLRVDAELTLWHKADNAVLAAEVKLIRSLEVAREQSALSWELRSALSLARLWSRNGRVADARKLLAATYDRFFQGFDTADLRAARTMLGSLAK